jgi:spermidine synthase
MTRRSRKRRGTAANRTLATNAEPADARAVRPDPGSDHHAHDRILLVGVAACFLLSGFAALLYQTVWFRQFSLVFGTSEIAIVAVLAAYMAGLAAGAALAARFVSRVSRPILLYGLLEAGIALSALAVPWLLAAGTGVYAWAFGGQPEPPGAAAVGQLVFHFSVAFLVLALPTVFMGATLPLLTRHVVRTNREVGPRVALLYATNTAGAVLGTVTAGFVLVPSIGLRATVWIGVLANALVFGVAALLARAPLHEPEVAPGTTAPKRGLFASFVPRPWASSGTEAVGELDRRATWILPLICASGANAFAYEVLWTRLLTHVLGASIYAFATMLGAFLTGIALGGAIAAKFTTDRVRAARAFVVAQVAIAAASMLVYAWVGSAVPDARDALSLAFFAALVMLPATIFIGATLPLSVRILTIDAADAGSSAARAYSWNTVGAIAGAMIAGFLLIPALGFEGAIRLAVSLNLFLALAAIWLLLERNRRVVGSAVAALTLVALVYTPPRPRAVIEHSTFSLATPRTSEEIFYAVGRSATVRLARDDGRFNLRTNGLPEASIFPLGTPRTGATDQLLTALPFAARADAKSMLMVGLGGGTALEDAPAALETIDVVEIEPEVLEANRRLRDLRRSDPLGDDRIRVVINDARNALRLTVKRYDLIVSQPSHPWTAGASHLFTREFAELGKSRLEEGGVFVQWMSPAFVDERLLKSLAASLTAVFSHVRIYYAGGALLLFLASDAPLDLERELLRTGQPLRDNPLYYGYLGFNGVEDFLATLLADEDGVRRFAADGSPSTDDKNLVATYSRTSGDGLEPSGVVALLDSYDPLLQADGWIHSESWLDLSFGAIGRRLLALGQSARAQRLADVVKDRSTAALLRGHVLSSLRKDREAVEAYEEALRLDESNDEARFALVRFELAAIVARRASPEAEDRLARLTGPAAAVVRGWQLAAAEDWRNLAELDPALARATATEIWFPEATQLRADWRMQVSGDRSYTTDALRLIDRSLAVRLDPDLLMLRAEAARALDDLAAFVESGRYAVEALDGYLDAAETGAYAMTASDASLLYRRIEAWRLLFAETLRTEARDNEVYREIDRASLRAERLAESRR